MTAILIIVGLCVAFVGHLLVLNSAFKTSVMWGLAALFIPFATLVYVAKNWEETRRAFMCWIGGFAVMLLAVMVTPSRPRPAVTAERKEEERRPAPVSAASALPPPPVVQTQPVLQPPQQQPEPLAEQVTDTAPAAPKLQQVYIDRTSKLYYRESCRRRPQSATRVAKSVAMMQGYKEARCD